MRWTQGALLTRALSCGRRSRVVVALPNENNAIGCLIGILGALIHLGFFPDWLIVRGGCAQCLQRIGRFGEAALL
jgi:hypothetical protein